MRPLATRTLVFATATVSKAWEPISVVAAAAHGADYLFPAALVLCEAAKLAVLLPMLALSRPADMAGLPIGWRASAVRYGVPAAALALCNLCLGYAVPQLGALLYQIVFQLSAVASTGGLAFVLLGERLAPGQWAALALLTVGSLGAIRSRTAPATAAALEAAPPAHALFATLVDAAGDTCRGRARGGRAGLRLASGRF